ncbi:MAG: CBS domain-containing protein [Burkholderiales bacterium]|nr:CBS domain-containing protein [Burkholderiales bacterium]
MTNETLPAVLALNERFFLDFPREAAHRLETMPAAEAAEILASQPGHTAVGAWQNLAPDVAHAILRHLPENTGVYFLTESEPAASAGVLTRLSAEKRERWLGRLDLQVARELRDMLSYPENSAGRLMDPRVRYIRADLTVGEAIDRLQAMKRRRLREMFVVDGEGRLTGRVELHDLAVADRSLALRDITHPLLLVAQELDPREEVVDLLQNRPITELPIVNHDGKFVGVIHQDGLMAAIEQETTVDIQTMVGASRDERALSGSMFAVRKRLPWLQINLLTAFLAATVVGLFEGTIARFTALAVLLPVVAGQSGNAGAQALAVTMRGIVLHEISLRSWPRMVWKEASVGLANGLAVALTTAIGVWLWSRSVGLVVVIALSMVISMVIAGVAGALTPILLHRFGQDPAQSSSIVLTTVTDVAGFMSFLGIATLLAQLLE